MILHTLPEALRQEHLRIITDMGEDEYRCRCSDLAVRVVELTEKILASYATPWKVEEKRPFRLHLGVHSMFEWFEPLPLKTIDAVAYAPDITGRPDRYLIRGGFIDRDRDLYVGVDEEGWPVLTEDGEEECWTYPLTETEWAYIWPGFTEEERSFAELIYARSWGETAPQRTVPQKTNDALVLA